MQNLYDSEAIRAMERGMFESEDSFSVMQRAGAAVAMHAQEMTKDSDLPILGAAGPGNNGGDVLVAAALLLRDGKKVRVALAGEESDLPPDAARALAMWREAGGKTETDIGDSKTALALDGIFGIGLSRPPSGRFAEFIEKLNAHRVLAVDVPSGVDADTGAAPGMAVRARRTITFLGRKPGLYTGAGASMAGDVVFDALGCGEAASPSGCLLDGGMDFSALRRDKDSHKGNFGTVVVLGGATGMVGAAVLAARAATRLGAGRTILMPLCPLPPPLDWGAPEILMRRPGDFAGASCIAAGPGMSANFPAWLRKAIDAPATIVADADALNILAKHKALGARFAERKAASVVTPHPAEAARLLQCETADVQKDRIAAARRLAKKFRAVAVLKGAGTVIATPSGSWTICAAGNPGLAQAGAGDVLSGMIAALLAQTEDAEFAARAGAWLHGAAADEIAGQSGEIGLDLNAVAPVSAHILHRTLANKAD